MCGITGYIETNGRIHSNQLREIIEQMTNALAHRGPDSMGVWFDPKTMIGLGHRRLSIVDLSKSGHQPMESRCGRWIITYNGEIYNHHELRSELEEFGWICSGHSDTEVLLGAISVWGIKAALKRFVGMFSFGVWDKKMRVLTLARDRIGEKPLYYGRIGTDMIWASELRAFCKSGQGKLDVNSDVLPLYFKYKYVPEPLTIFRNIKKLPPGSFLSVPLAAASEILSLNPEHYWHAQERFSVAQSEKFMGNEDEAKLELERLVKISVNHQLKADVNVGAFLSGGIDSSWIVALAQEERTRCIKTFTIGFQDSRFNEAKTARNVADYLGTEHTDLYVDEKTAQSVTLSLSEIYDEPFADGSQIPTVLVSRLAKKDVTVALTGDGGDELFCGYNRYIRAISIWKVLKLVPWKFRNVVKQLLQLIPVASWDQVINKIPQFVNSYRGYGKAGDRIHKLSQTIGAQHIGELFLQSIEQIPTETSLFNSHMESNESCYESMRTPKTADEMMLFDLVNYLPGDILTKVDRAAMSVSLETRIPLLDHRLVEFAWQLPLSMKFKQGTTKRLIRSSLFERIPASLLKGPKKGFGVPLGSWLKNGLRGWSESLLTEERLRRDGYFNPVIVRHLWDQHLEGKRDCQYFLWNVLMFNSWLDRWHKS